MKPEHSLSDEQIDQYRNEGFVVVERLFDADDLARVDATIRQMTDQALAGGDFSKVLELEPEPVDGKRVPRRIFNPYDQHETFRGLAHDARLLDKIESLIGGDFNLQHSKLNMKPAKVGSVVEWHQDMAYFPHTNDDLVTTLIYLDDATEENGCLQVLPRHHTHFFDHSGPDGRFAGMITESLADSASRAVCRRRRAARFSCTASRRTRRCPIARAALGERSFTNIAPTTRSRFITVK